MSRIKSLSDNLNSSECNDIDNINPNLRVAYNQILNDMKNQFFFDEYLTHEHLLFILNQRNTIGSKLIQFLKDRIDNLNIPCDIRERLISNIIKFSTSFIHININIDINYDYHVNYDSDEESYVDYSTDDIYSDEDDDYNDLENLILDQIEMEHNINVSNNTQGNQDE